ncbi:MAG: CpaF family protein [Kiloniellales bacterium]|nr:CpaF family protein [Kiloniellales bacterium]
MTAIPRSNGAGQPRRPQGPGGGDQGADLSPHLERLKPIVLEAFADDDVSKLPRPQLAIRMGEIVTVALDQGEEHVDLLTRRLVVTELISWLLQAGPSAAGPMSPGGGTGDDNPEVYAAKKKAMTPLPTVEKAREKIQPIVLERIDVTAATKLPRDELGMQIGDILKEVLDEERMRLNAVEQEQLVELLLDDMLGLGPLEPLLADEAVTDIMVNGPRQTYVERGGKLEMTDVVFRNNDHLLNVARRIVSQIGRRVDESTPMVDARLLDGSRVNIIIPPLAIDGASISIRKFAKKGITLDIMARQGNISDKMCAVLKVAARSRLNILISGGTGSGKTTLLNALSQMIDQGERIVTIEDAAELQLQQPHVVRLETRPANLEGEGEVTMRDLVKNSLRMRPDRIILGEVRGAEAVDMLQAMNTGHDGSLGTVHANRPREALTRLENMVGMAGINLPSKAVRTQIAAALDVIVQISRMRDGVRRVTSISEVVGMEGDVITTQELFNFKFEGQDTDGKITGVFKSTGLRPHFTSKAAYFGLDKVLLEAI